MSGATLEGNLTRKVSCTVTDPHWSVHAFAESDLPPQRYDDSDPQGGTALAYYVDGASTTGWDALAPTIPISLSRRGEDTP